MNEFNWHFPALLTTHLFELSKILFMNFEFAAHYSFHFRHLDNFKKFLNYFFTIFTSLALFCLRHSILMSGLNLCLVHFWSEQKISKKMHFDCHFSFQTGLISRACYLHLTFFDFYLRLWSCSENTFYHQLSQKMVCQVLPYFVLKTINFENLHFYKQ